MAGVGLGDIQAPVAWQAWHSVGLGDIHTLFCVAGVALWHGLDLVARLGPAVAWQACYLVTAGVVFGDIHAPVAWQVALIHAPVAWQAWHLLTSTMLLVSN